METHRWLLLPGEAGLSCSAAWPGSGTLRSSSSAPCAKGAGSPGELIHTQPAGARPRESCQPLALSLPRLMAWLPAEDFRV